MWVRSEYAGELAVLSAWLTAVVPWNVTWVDTDLAFLGIDGVMLRSGLFEVLFAWSIPEFGGDDIPFSGLEGVLRNGIGFTGLPITDTIWVSNPIVAGVQLQAIQDGTVQNGAIAEAVGGALVLAAFALSLAMYVAEDRVEEGPVDPVRAMGALIGLAAVAFTAATYFYWSSFLPGLPIPIGIPIMAVLSGVLLTVERTGDADEPAADPESGGA